MTKLSSQRPGYCPQCRPWWLVYKWSSALSPPGPIRLAPGGYMTQTTGLVSRQNSDTFSRKILLRGWLNILNIHKISKCNLRRKSPEDILYKSGRNLLIRNLLSRVNCLKIRLEIYSKFGANIFEIIFEHFRNNADTQHFSVLKGYLRFSRHFLVDTLI